MQEAQVVRIQAFMRAKKAKKDYKQLGKLTLEEFGVLG